MSNIGDMLVDVKGLKSVHDSIKNTFSTKKELTDVDNKFSEVNSARQSGNGTTYNNLKARLDADKEAAEKDISALKADLADVTNHTVKSAEQLISDKRTTDKVPYKYRASASGKSDRAYDMIVGGTVCFNQLVNIQGSDISKTENGVTFTDNEDGTYTVSTDANGATAQTQLYISSGEYADTINHVVFVCGSPSNASGDTYLLYTNTNILGNGKIYISNTNVPRLRIIVKSGVVITTPVTFKPQIFDLTQMFGTTIANQIYSIEQATAGAGIALFRAMFQNEYYPHNPGELISVAGLSAHVMRDADDNIVGSYPLDSTLTLRGVTVIKDGKIEFDGDTYEADGTVTRKYAERAYQSGDELLADAITDGTNTVYKLSTATTETATPYTSPQIVDPYGTEEYISETVCPVGHVTEYPDNLRAKIDGLPWDLSMIAPVEVAYTATRNYTVGQLLIVDNVLYKVTANIANGGIITPNTNVVATTLSEIISALA